MKTGKLMVKVCFVVLLSSCTLLPIKHLYENKLYSRIGVVFGRNSAKISCHVSCGARNSVRSVLMFLLIAVWIARRYFKDAFGRIHGFY